VKVLLASGAMGFGFGLLHASWQDAVEGAQAAAGVVSYPPSNPFGIYLANTWTLLHQIPAVMVALGVPELTLTKLLSGLIGMLQFQGIALGVLALSSDMVIATLAPLVVVLAAFSDPPQVFYPGAGYIVALFGSGRTYGMVGAHLSLLTLALIANGCSRAAGVVLGLLPAVHPVWGVCTHALVGLAALVEGPRTFGDDHKQGIRYLAGGYLITLTSLACHFALSYRPVLDVDRAEVSQLFWVVVRFWDPHRQPLSVMKLGPALALLGAATGAAALARSNGPLSPKARGFVAALVGGVSFGVPLSFLYWLPTDWAPPVLVSSMPHRLLNLGVPGLPIVFLGVLARDPSVAGRWMLIVLAVLLLVRGPVPSAFWMALAAASYPLLSLQGRPGARAANALVGIGLLCGSVWLLSAHVQSVRMLEAYGRGAQWTGAVMLFAAGCTLLVASLVNARVSLGSQISAPGYRWAAIVVLAVGGSLAFSRSYADWIDRPALRDGTNDPFWEQVSRGRGLLVTASNVPPVQTRTRRPILLDGLRFNMLPYVPGAAPEMARILREVYGIDLLSPPPDVALLGPWINEKVKERWEDRTPEQWQVLGTRFGFTDVLASSDWNLRLPVAAEGRGLSYYRLGAP
jgi:hypothetical protein